MVPKVSFKVIAPKENSMRAELIWALKTIANNYSFQSCEGVKEVFMEMFPDTKLLEYFTLSPKKLSYLITEALGPYFKQKMLADLGKGMIIKFCRLTDYDINFLYFVEYFALLYDETTNKSGQKELQFEIRYWSQSVKKILTRHLQTFYINHATAEILLQKLNEALNNAGLSQGKLLMLGSDGPNINKKVFRLMNEELKITRRKGLIDLGTCSIHSIHNAFLKGLNNFGSEVSELLVSIKYFFKDNPSRWSDFTNIQSKLKIEHHHFIKHVSTRWLTIGPAAKRLIEQWPSVKEYFLKYVPTKCHYIEKTTKYKNIVKCLKDPTTKAAILFVISSSELFTKYTGMFQKSEPLVHLMYTEIKLLIVTVMNRFCKKVSIELLETNNVHSIDELFKTENLKPLEEISLTAELHLEISELKTADKTRVLNDIKNHYIAACKYILKNIPILQKSTVIKHLRCLSPSNINSKKGVTDISELIRNLPFEVQSDQAVDEWRLLQLEIDSGSLKLDSKQRVDLFWCNVFEMERAGGVAKYPTLATVIKPLLSLSHGNADVERLFSSSGRLVTKERASMSERMVNSVLSVLDILKSTYNNKVELVPITKELLSLASVAHRSYQAYLDKRKAEAELKEKQEFERQEEVRQEEELKKQNNLEKQKIEELEIEIKNLTKKESQKKQAGDQLLSEANLKLSESLKRNDLIQVDVAKSLLIAAQNLRSEELEYDNMKSAIIRQVNKRKSDLLLKYARSGPPNKLKKLD